ncbi:hypothetical protein OIU84_020750 [Salix udensis]|uniref:Phosphoribosylformylglycinamidine synthase linker domain-containing protein n=1 Tax=Salix udensis TaxID=889485 RepID=A0AAD6PG75_9ROSI|nr:hypothetical protein OIU84_020750 [Salix udensis]
MSSTALMSGFSLGFQSRSLGLALRWFQKETYDPENLGTGSFLEKKMKEGVDCGLTEVTRLGRSRRSLHVLKPVYVGLEEVRYFPVMERGRRALEEINQETGLAFDEQDLQYYTRLSREDIKRNPTTVELFDVSQSNCSEHSRHWFVTGNIIMNRTLMQIVKSTLQANPNNSVIDFRDNSSAIKGFPPRLIIADGSYAPWEDRSFPYPSNLASPLQILIDGSSINGSSDYGNKRGDAEMAQKPYVLYDPALRWEENPASSKETTHHIPCSKKGEKTTTGTTDGCVRRSEERRKLYIQRVLKLTSRQFSHQEQDAILVKAESRDFLQSIYKSESSRCLLYMHGDRGWLNGEGADNIYDVVTALSEAMIELGIAIDGVRDSLSMAAHAGQEILLSVLMSLSLA